MATSSAAKVEYLPVSLKSVVPVIPEKILEKEQLIEDLTKMGCENLLAAPWSLKSEAMVQEFQQPRSNEWEGTIRRDPEHWTADLWSDVYNFRKEGRMRAGRSEPWVDGKFKQVINPKDGHAVCDCIDPRERRVLEFVVPILYPEKPGRVTKEVGNTIFGALSGEYKVSWGQVIHEVVDKLVSVLSKRKPTPVSPYLFHLYYKSGCLRKEELQKMEVARECLEMGFAPEEEPDEEQDDSDRASLSPDVRRQSTPSPGKRMKTTLRSPRGKSPIRDLSCLDTPDDVFQRVQDDLYQVRSRYNKMEIVIRSATKLLGDCKAGNLSKEIRKLKEESGSGLKTQNEQLKLRIAELQGLTKAQGAEVERLRSRNADLGKIREALALPGDVLTRAQLFDEDVKKEGQLSGQKILTILVKYGHKMEATLEEMRKLLPGPVETEPNQPASQATAPPPPPPQPKTPAPTYEELQERVAAFTQATEEILAKSRSPAKPGVKVTLPSFSMEKGKEAESGTAAARSEPVSEKGSNRKKKKEVTPEVQTTLELSDSESSGEEEEEEEEPETPLVDKRRTRSSEKKKPQVYSSPQAPKRQQKSAGKGEGSRKKPKK